MPDGAAAAVLTAARGHWAVGYAYYPMPAASMEPGSESPEGEEGRYVHVRWDLRTDTLEVIDVGEVPNGELTHPVSVSATGDVVTEGPRFALFLCPVPRSLAARSLASAGQSAASCPTSVMLPISSPGAVASSAPRLLTG